jgi:hypothetical protein
MKMIIEIGTILLVLLVALIVMALPLYVSAKVLGGRITFLKAIFVSVGSGVIVALIQNYYAIWGGVLAFLVLILIYKYAFRLGWLRALFVWLLQGAVAIILVMIGMSLGFIL